VLSEWFGRGVIRSCAKLDYGTAQAVIEARDDGRTVGRCRLTLHQTRVEGAWNYALETKM
jgi:exoribonuclease R